MIKRSFKTTTVKPAVKYLNVANRKKGRYLSVITIGVLLVLWAVIGKAEIVSELYWPSISTVTQRFWNLCVEGYKGRTLGEHLLISVYRVLAGFLAGTIFGVLIGIWMGVNQIFRRLIDPVIELYRPVPPLAYIPLIIIWLGISDLSKITLLFLAAFAVIVINTRAGIERVSIEKIQAAYSLGAIPRQVLRHVIFINSLPEILTGMRIALGVCWGTLVASEMIAAKAGIGWMVLNASRYLRTDIVIIGIIVMGVMGYLFDFLLRLLEKKLVPWKGK